MAVVRFEPAGVDFHVAPGEALVDVCDEHPETRVPLSCRDANCGSCRVTVLEGAAALAPVAEHERTRLAALHAPASTRLCCQLRVIAPDPRIVLVVETAPRP